MNTISTENGLVLAMFVLAAATVVVLLSVIYLQGRTIDKLNSRTNKIGFLGKPLSLFALALFSVGTVGIFLYGNQNIQTPDSVSVSDETSSIYRVRVVSEEINKSTNTYRFSAVPSVDGIDWGLNPDRKFDVYWSINGVQSKIEYGLSRNFNGGIVLRLTEEINTIKAVIYFEDQVASGSVNIQLEK